MTPPVTKAARDAAADLSEAENCPPKIGAGFRDGTFDDNCRTQAFAKAIAEERELCAKIAESYDGPRVSASRVRGAIATAIRAHLKDIQDAG